MMVMALERIIALAELATRAGKAVKALQSSGHGPAAAVLQQETDRACKQIVQKEASRRRSASRARKRNRIGGRFA